VPEGDTIWRTAAGLRARLLDKVVMGARPPALARLRGAKVTAVEANGKHLLMRFDSGMVLHSHMRMTGSWHVYTPGAAWRKPARLVSAVLEFADVTAVAFSAPVVELLPSAASAIGHLGPDVLAADFDLAVVLARARASESATLGELLLDQRVCAGIGNVYKCEALWACHEDPWRRVDSCNDDILAGLFVTARAQMRQNLGGFRRRFEGGGHAVHGRSGRPCRRCGQSIAVRAQGEQARLTYFCAGCQSSSGSSTPPRQTVRQGTP
jgi:endonuclease-8